MPRAVWVHLALIGANLLYAGNYTIAKEVMPEHIQALGFIFVRVLVALVFYWVIHFMFIRERIERKDLGRLVLCGATGVAINQLFFFSGLDLTTPINAAIMMITTPILVLVFAAVFVDEKMTILKSLGVMLGMGGALTLVSFGNEATIGADTYVGDILVFINATSYSIYLVIAKPLMKKYHPLTVVKWVFLFGSFIVVPVGYEQFAAVEWSGFTSSIWMYTAYVVIGVTIMAYFLNIYALKHSDPSLVGIYIYSQPAMAGIIAIAANRDTLDWVKVVATILIFAGVYLVSYKTSKPVNN